MLLAILLPPLAVYRRAGGLRPAFWICVALTLAFYLPGVAFAVWAEQRHRRRAR